MPQTVDSVGEVLKILNELVPDVEQVVDVCPRSRGHLAGLNRRFVDFLRQPQTAEQFVELLGFDFVFVRPIEGASSTAVCRAGCARHWVELYRQPRAVYKYWAPVTSLCPCLIGSSSLRWTVDGASLQFLDRVVDIAVCS